MSTKTQPSRQKRKAALEGSATKWTLRYIVKKTVKDSDKRLHCEVWHNNDDGVNNERLPPCPTNIDQMRGDDRYIKEGNTRYAASKDYFKKKDADSCYRQVNVG